MSASFVMATGTEFTLNGVSFRVNGVNCYFLAYCSDTSRRAALAVAKRMGANVVRTWAFLAMDAFSPGGIVIHDGLGCLERLDALIQSAEEAGVKLILPLVNHWDAFGGMPTWVKSLGWNLNRKTLDVTHFYRGSEIKTAYKTWLQTILTRRNKITGRFYADEPAIMAWELTNEARCQTRGGRELLLSWIEEMASFVKQHDRNHLLALGDEGFFYKGAQGHLYDGRYGVDWVANLAVEGIDFGTFHFYPQDWGQSHDPNFRDEVGYTRSRSCRATSEQNPPSWKRVGLKIDGKLIETAADRDACFAKLMETIQAQKAAGQLLWMLGYAAGDDTKGFVDDYVIYGAEEVPCLLSSQGKAAISQESSS